MDLHHPRAAALCAAVSAALVVGMAGTAAAFSPPDPPAAHFVADRLAPVTGGAATTPAVTGRTPAP
ncbi:hypothetical protein [Pseudonocardia abyssalis]|uniref:Uncharacterized protein n=1 Tax=Pseudonocardia abyssalis TaxID=2792008 RepID=A0ABS6UX30_9PSEU|nr:hypothetical protein [Pseudonocardia abyssalis]MBW0116718.1 hypothetical protein [Pseudonocardia abyssalis]MBW0136801.1 hypothetical protein [Pseudonocardia abyssalis]